MFKKILFFLKQIGSCPLYFLTLKKVEENRNKKDMNEFGLKN
jgi:hypothetical protein